MSTSPFATSGLLRLGWITIAHLQHGIRNDTGVCDSAKEGLESAVHFAAARLGTSSSVACNRSRGLTTPYMQISFTFILPLFPKLIEFYRNHETGDPNTILSKILAGLNAYKNSFAKPINSRYDIVLLGGALGSLFSLCQAIASPFIGTLSDKYGRRTALLWSMVGNIFSVALWVAATDFRTFLASRVVGGLSEGNVQLAMAIATDISDDSQRGATMALVGVCFSIAFTFGPALGAYLSTLQVMDKNPFAMAAGFSLFLIISETIYLYLRRTRLRTAQQTDMTKAVKHRNLVSERTRIIYSTRHILLLSSSSAAWNSRSRL